MSVQVALERARVAKEIGRIEQARQILGGALAHAPDDPEVLVALGDIAFSLDRPDEALRWAGQAIVVDPERADAHALVAMAAASLGEWDRALAHGETVVRLLPHDAPSLLVLAWLLAYGPHPDGGRAEAALTEAVSLAPNDADVHCSVAETYGRLTDLEAVRRHVAAGLALDPTHVDLLRMQARIEFGGIDGGRQRAVEILRGVLAQSPSDVQAKRLLAEVHWRAMMRLAAWVWCFAGCYAAAAMWAPPMVLRVLSPLLFVALPFAWFGVFRKLREQLPAGYLRARTMRPRTLLALAMAAASGLVVDLGAVVMRSQYVEFVRLGSLLLLLGTLAAALAHLLFYTAWLRPGRDDPDPDDGFDFAFGQVIVIAAFGAPLVVVAALARGWARQPAVFGALLAVFGAVFFTVVLEAGIAVWRGRGGFRRLPAIALVTAALLIGAGAAVWWGGGEIVTGEVRGRELVQAPATPTSSPRPLPTIPSRLLRTPSWPLPSSAEPTPSR
ncbi:tetratricopeptide repeat protein [Nocardia sp. NPDC127606]|uniref:tetratricopeptide repeat protein n=1 Tax=Nocardia sp. NPDC127606 TaxID=3345406 RepID=UPI00362C8327